MAYQEVKFNLSKSQGHKLALAHKTKSAVTLRLNKTNVSPNGIPLMLTKTEVKKIQSGNTHNIELSASRVKQGGFLPALLAAIPTIAGIIGGISGLTGIASNIKTMITGSGYCGCKGKGFISDLNIPLISPLAKIVGLGNKSKGLYLYPKP